MKRWGELFPGAAEPLTGHSADYALATSETHKLRSATVQISEEFRRISSSTDLAELRGEAAGQLITLVEGIDAALHAVPPVLEPMEAVFRRHEEELRRLERRAGEALARANTRWTRLEAAESDASSARRALESVERQIRQLDWSSADPETIEERRRELERQERVRRGTYNDRMAERNAASDRFEESREERHELELDEGELIERTLAGLACVELGDLKDPNRLLEWASGVIDGIADWAVGVWDTITALVEAVSEGRWMDALWHLSDLLEAALTALAVVALAVAIFATGGAALFFIGVGLAAGKLLADAVLAGTKHPHPETGETKSWTDVVVDAGVLAFTIATRGLGDKIMKTDPRQRSVWENIQRVFRPQSSSGKPIYGAAAESMRDRSIRELTAEAIDQGAGKGVDMLADWLKGEPWKAEPEPLTTDIDSWTLLEIVDHAEGVERPGLVDDAILRCGASMERYFEWGPSLDDDVAGYRLVAA